MYRDEDDLQLLAELAGVLDQTVTDAGLSRAPTSSCASWWRTPGPTRSPTWPRASGAGPTRWRRCAGGSWRPGWRRRGPTAWRRPSEGVATAAALEERANDAMLAYVIERPHTATVYGLVAAMQSGRFTVEDLLRFIAEGPSDGDPEA